MKYSQNRANAAVIYLRKGPRLSHTQSAKVLYLNVKTVWTKIQRAKKNGTFKDFDNRRLPRRTREHLNRTFKSNLGYYQRIWDFIYGIYDTIEEAMRGEHDAEEPP